MIKCWANCIGGCSDKISGEHLVSKGIFDNNIIIVEGGPWSKSGTEKEIGINSLTAKILCIDHNNALSILDDEAIRAFNILKKIDDLLSIRSKMKSRKWQIIDSEKIDGYLLERWLLKTSINFCFTYSHPKPLGVGFKDNSIIPNELVNIVFGKEEFPSKMGLHVAFGNQQKFHLKKDQIVYNAITLNDRVAGVFYSFRNFRFFLSLTNIEDQTLFEGLPQEWGKPIIKIRPSKINYKIDKYISHRVWFKWHKNSR